MMNDKRKYLIFLLILIAFVSVGGVSANNQDNTTSISNVDVLDETVLIDDSLYDEQPIIEVDSTTDFNNTVEVDDNPQLSSQDDSFNNLLSNEGSDYVVNSPIVNPDFEEGLDGWDGYGVSITEFFFNSKSGTKFVSLSANGHISQFINFDTIDSVSFWYMSNTENATIDIYIDDVFLDNYTIQKNNVGLGKKQWKEVRLDLSNFMGFHTLNITQNYGLGYLDYFNIVYNKNVVANFTIDSYEIFDGKISINFKDLSQGLITEYLWDFGDGKYSNNQNPTHTFKLNSYIITLTVFNNDMESSYSFSLPVSVCKIQNTNIEFPSIQDAIDFAVDGDIISIFSNYFTDNHFENLIIDKSVTLNFINASINPKNSSKPTIKVINESQVVINNLLLGDCENIFKTSDDSSLTIQNSNITNKNMILDDGNIFFENNILVNSYLTVLQSNTSILNSNISNGAIIVNGGKSIINNDNFSFCDVAVKQNQGITNIINCNFSSCDVAYSQDGGNSKISYCNFSSCNIAIQQDNGQLNLTRNLIEENDIGIKSFGNADIHFNNIYRNNNFSLIVNENVDYSNNWWGTNNPTYFSSLIMPNDYYDVYFVNESSSDMKPWIILNITQHDLDYHYWIGGVTYYNLTIDLAHNNLGEDISSFGSLETKNYTFFFNNVPFDIFIEEGFKEYLFSWGYLTGEDSELKIQFTTETITLPLKVDSIAPNITYITPSATFKDTIEVEIECDEPSAVIFYTLDGTNPCNSPTRLVYSEPIVIDKSVTVHATAIDFNGNFARCNYTWIGIATVPSIFSWENYYYDYAVTLLKESDFVDSDYVWGRYQDNNGVSNYSGPINNLSSWSNVNIISSGSAVIDNDGRIYIGGDDGYLYCLNSQGLVIWRYGTYSKIICTPVIGNDGNIYFNNWMNSTLYCISPEGQLIWKYWLGDYNDGSNPVFGLDNTLYVITNNESNSNLYAFKNGALLWNCSLPLISGSTPAVAGDGSIYLVSADHELICVNWDGTLKYSFSLIATHLLAYSKINVDLKETRVSVTIGEDNTIYVINQPHYFISNLTKGYSWIPESWYSIRAYNNDGSLKWFSLLYDDVSSAVKTSYVLFGAPTYYDGVLYLNDQYSLIAVNATDGSILWKSVLGGGLTYYLNDNFIWDSSISYAEAPKFKVLHITSDMTNAEMNLVATDAAIKHGVVIFPNGNSGSYNDTSLFEQYAGFNGGMVIWDSGDYSFYNTSDIVGNNSISYTDFAPTFSSSSPLISSNGLIYVTKGNMVYALTLAGEPVWSYSIPGQYGGAFSLSGPSLTDDGTLIVTTNQGIYAFNDIAADFSYAHVNGTERTIQFTDLSTKGNNSYFWSFGDGFTSQEQNPEHIYAEAGKYRVELVVEHDGINLARNTTIVVESWDITPPSPVNVYINDVKTRGGIFNQTQVITMDAFDDCSGVTIYYTVDGSNPVNSSTRRLYTEPVPIESFTVLNVVAVDESNNWGRVSTLTFNITDAINVNDRINSTLIQKIQELLDNAEPNSKFVFDYTELYGANFTINKPLNIITNVNTLLIGNNNQPVFTLGENAGNTTINGFTIENSGVEGILIRDANNISVINSIVSAKDSTGISIIDSNNTLVKNTLVDNSTDGIKVENGINTLLNKVTVTNSLDNGVWILRSDNTTLTNSLLENNGEDPYFSMANQILLDSSTNTKITNNRVNYGVFGIHLKNTNENILIDNNTIYEGIGDAIYLTGRYINMNITHNTLEGCFMGIDFNGYSENVDVQHNVIWKIHSHDGEPESGAEYDLFYGFKHTTDLYGQYDNAIQVFELADNFHNGVHIENNICVLVEHRAWESRKTFTYTESNCDGYGYNLWDGSDSYNWRTTGTTHYRTGFVDLVLDRVGDASYRLRLINQRTGEYLSEIPAFDVTFTSGRYTQTVKFVNDSAIATFDVASSITTITATISAEIKKSISWNIPISEGHSSSNKDKDSGYEAGEAINNPNPKAPSISDMINRFNGNGNGNGDGNGNGNGQGTGTGNGQGSGNGHGSHGHGGSNVNGREGEIEGNANNLIQTDSGNSPSVGSEAAAEGDSDSVEGGSESGEGSEEPVNAYEVSKVINIDKSNVNFVAAVILFAVIIILGYGYRRIKKDGDEF